MRLNSSNYFFTFSSVPPFFVCFDPPLISTLCVLFNSVWSNNDYGKVQHHKALRTMLISQSVSLCGNFSFPIRFSTMISMCGPRSLCPVVPLPKGEAVGIVEGDPAAEPRWPHAFGLARNASLGRTPRRRSETHITFHLSLNSVYEQYHFNPCTIRNKCIGF